MKILATGDFHGDTKKAEAMAKKALEEDVDLILLCGDILHGDQAVEGMLKPFAKTGKEVMFVTGNHDNMFYNDLWEKMYEAKSLHGKGFAKGDLGVFGTSGCNCGMQRLTEEELFHYLREGHKQVEKAKKRVMVSHTHPAGSLGEKFSSFIEGSSGVTKAIYELKPDILFCCHVHEAEGLEELMDKTKIINVGSKGKVIEL